MKQDKSIVFRKLTSTVIVATACMCSINQSRTGAVDHDATNSAATPHATAGIETDAGTGVGAGVELVQE